MHIVSLYVPVIKALTVGMIALFLGLMVIEVIMRYLFGSSLIWAEEACRYLLIWSSFLAAVLAYERGELANVAIFRQLLPPKGRVIAAIAANALSVIFLTVLVIYGYAFASRVGSQPIPAMRFLLGDLFGADFPIPSMFWVYISLPVGMFILAVRMTVDLIRQVITLIEGGDLGSQTGKLGT